MKKIFLSLMATALLFSACGNDDDGVQNGQTGELNGTIKFSEDGGLRATAGTAIPLTSWKNINTLRMFLYDGTTGKIAFSCEVPKSQASSFSVKDVPVGTSYTLAIVANAKQSTDEIWTTTTGWGTSGTPANAMFTDLTVKDKIINTDVAIGFKEGIAADFPVDFSTEATIQNKTKTPVSTSEVFVAYANNVKIEADKSTTVQNLELERIVSLMRVRVVVDGTKVTTKSKLKFANRAESSILVHNTPGQLNLALGATTSGSTSLSYKDKIIVGAKGTDTYRTDKPATTTHSIAGSPTVQGDVLMGEFEYWQEFLVYPNAGGSGDRRYFVVLSAFAEEGHVFSDNSKAPVGGSPVYWSANIDRAYTFSPNKIREVNVTITTGGVNKPIIEPGETGELVIECKDPLPWNSVVEQVDVEM